MDFLNKHFLFRVLLTATIIFLFAYMFWPFFTPLLLAALFSFALETQVSNLTFRFKNRKLVTLGFLIAIGLFVAAPITLITLKTISTIKVYSSVGLQNSQIYKLTEQLVIHLTDDLNSIAQRFDFDTTQLPKLTDLLGQTSSSIANIITNILTSLPQKTLSVLVFFAGLFYFISEAESIKKFFLNLDILSSAEFQQVVQIIKKSSYLTLIASAVVGSLQALIVASFGYFCGFTEFILLFVITFILSLIPVLGATPVAIFLAVLAFIQGQNGAMIGMLVASAIASSIDNVIKPIIVNSSSENLHPLISLLALVGAIFVYGAPGILLGPILTQLALNIKHILFPSQKHQQQET